MNNRCAAQVKRYPILDIYPREVRRKWSSVEIAKAHSDYCWFKLRDPLTIAMESEYQRRARKRRRMQVAQARWTYGTA